MSTTPLPEAPIRRVRHHARDALAVMAFSAGASAAFAMALLMLISVGQ